ncbi:MAG TPA: c-type cytochrome biogenesis protein CcmI [Candidimonas sp.]|nr:c-type cytochrome biogenesis protein CcmI [Candidimonas sp.]
MTEALPIFIAIAILFVAVGLAFVLPPLLGWGRYSDMGETQQAAQATMALAVLREQWDELETERAAGRINQEAWRRDRDELERRALDEGHSGAPPLRHGPAGAWAAGVAVFISIFSVAGYLLLGEPASLDGKSRQAPERADESAAMAEMVRSLAGRLAQGPGEPQEWYMLARSYMVLGDYSQASAAFAQLASLRPDHPDTLADWAEAVALEHNSVVEASERLARKALALEPDHVKALLLFGTAAFQRGDYAQAATLWEKILAQSPHENEDTRELRITINDARSKAGLGPLAVP